MDEDNAGRGVHCLALVAGVSDFHGFLENLGFRILTARAMSSAAVRTTNLAASPACFMLFDWAAALIAALLS